MKEIIKVVLLTHVDMLKVSMVGTFVITTILLIHSIAAGDVILSIIFGISTCIFLIHTLYIFGIIRLNSLNSKVIDLAQFEFKGSTIFEDVKMDLKKAEELNKEYEKFIIRGIRSKKIDSFQLGTITYCQGRYITAKEYFTLLMLSYLNLGNSKEKTQISKLLSDNDRSKEIIKSLKKLRGDSNKGNDEESKGKYGFL